MILRNIGGRRVWLSSEPEQDGALLLQPVADPGRESLEEEAAQLHSLCPGPFVLAAFESDWFRELSPWEAPALFRGQEGFGSGAPGTLRWIEDSIPSLTEKMGKPVIFLGGYSLAGLFALWAGYVSPLFAGIAAASPSVWFPGWREFVSGRPFSAGKASLSLGDREEDARHPILRTVGDALRSQEALFRAQGVPCVTEWNPGNHFAEPEKRMARCFARLLSLQDPVPSPGALDK